MSLYAGRQGRGERKPHTQLHTEEKADYARAAIEIARRRGGLKGDEALEAAKKMLRKIGIHLGEESLKNYATRPLDDELYLFLLAERARLTTA